MIGYHSPVLTLNQVGIVCVSMKHGDSLPIHVIQSKIKVVNFDSESPMPRILSGIRHSARIGFSAWSWWQLIHITRHCTVDPRHTSQDCKSWMKRWETHNQVVGVEDQVVNGFRKDRSSKPFVQIILWFGGQSVTRQKSMGKLFNEYTSICICNERCVPWIRVATWWLAQDES